ncbi:MAG: FAD-dependent oxidoreductase [Clostridia bacterium]|nr:FAD-dependent oxidoreductase [Clostridia bacterium]
MSKNNKNSGVANLHLESSLESLPREEMSVTRRVLVIGGGIAGVETALQCAERGFQVTLIERSEKLGGAFGKLAALVEAGENPKDYLQSKFGQLEKNPLIEVLTQTQLVDLTGLVGNFTATLVTGTGKRKVKVGAVTIAVGLQTVFCPVKYGLAMEPNVLGLTKLTGELIEGKSFTGKDFTFVLGKTTENFVLPFISALKNAIYLKEKFGSGVSIFYTNMKVGGDGLEALYGQARNLGINFFKISENLELKLQNNQVTVSFQDPFIGNKLPGKYQVVSDYIVIPEEIVPVENIAELVEVLKVKLDAADFLGENNVHVGPQFTSREGIYVVDDIYATSCLAHIKQDAELVAGEIAGKLPAEAFSVEGDQPQVDAAKCVVCLTCFRCCPHKAIEILHDAEKYNNLYGSAARMNPLACRRCGVCVAECPGKAIQMPGYQDAQVVAVLEGLVG